MASCLANMAHDLGLGNHVMESPHLRVSNLLLFDVSEVSFSRSISV